MAFSSWLRSVSTCPWAVTDRSAYDNPFPHDIRGMRCRKETTMPMKYDVSRCSICGETAIGTLESVPGLALLVFNERGEAEYAGETKLDWNNQINLRDSEDRVTLACRNGHQWQSPMNDDSDLGT